MSKKVSDETEFYLALNAAGCKALVYQNDPSYQFPTRLWTKLLHRIIDSLALKK